MEISQADMDRLVTRAGEILDMDATPEQVEATYRQHRVRYFTRLWERTSAYTEAAVDDTIVKGEIPTVEQRVELYRIQMHAIVLISLFGALKTQCVGHFTQGFLDAAERAGSTDARDFPWFATLDMNADLEASSEAVTRGFAEAMRYACTAVADGMETEQRVSLIAARNKDCLVVVPGFTDPRLKSTTTIHSLDVDPHRLPNKPMNDVDYVEDVLKGLQNASADSKMKADAHEFIAQRVALRELRLWRGNYFHLEV